MLRLVEKSIATILQTSLQLWEVNDLIKSNNIFQSSSSLEQKIVQTDHKTIRRPKPSASFSLVGPLKSDVVHISGHANSTLIRLDAQCKTSSRRKVIRKTSIRHHVIPLGE